MYSLWQKLKTDARLQPVRYCLVGAVNTSLTLSLFVLFKFFGLAYFIYSPLGYAAGFISSYFLNRAFTFAATGKKILAPFLLVNGGLFLAIQAAQSLVIEKTGWPDLPVVVCFMVLYTGCGFFLNRRLFAAK